MKNSTITIISFILLWVAIVLWLIVYDVYTENEGTQEQDPQIYYTEESQETIQKLKKQIAYERFILWKHGEYRYVLGFNRGVNKNVKPWWDSKFEEGLDFTDIFSNIGEWKDYFDRGTILTGEWHSNDISDLINIGYTISNSIELEKWFDENKEYLKKLRYK